MQNRTRYQERVIRNFYQNRDAISLQRAQELLTEVYLAEGKQRVKHWKNLLLHLEKLGVPQVTRDHLLKEDNPELAAQVVKSLGQK